MTDSTKLAAAIARHREVEGKAIPNWDADPHSDNNPFDEIWCADNPDSAAEGVLARNSHAALLGIAETAAKLRECIEQQGIMNECCDALDAALARLTEAE